MTNLPAPASAKGGFNALPIILLLGVASVVIYMNRSYIKEHWFKKKQPA